MQTPFFSDAELILHPDGSVYHLKLKPENIGSTIITVGDPQRVAAVSRHFDRIVFKNQHREFLTHTGFIGQQKISVISTGIGTDNIDIVINEIDALVNIDLKKRVVKPIFTPLQFIRIGTSGAIQSNIPVDSILVSKHVIGLDGLMPYYSDASQEPILKALNEHLDQSLNGCSYSTCSEGLNRLLPSEWKRGLTLTMAGFYGPQGRTLRMKPRVEHFFEKLVSFEFKGIKPTNMEMETAGIYGLCSELGHQAISINAILANRITGAFSTHPEETIDQCIQEVLARLSSI